jgi:hypothetical protein
MVSHTDVLPMVVVLGKEDMIRLSVDREPECRAFGG